MPSVTPRSDYHQRALRPAAAAPPIPPITQGPVYDPGGGALPLPFRAASSATTPHPQPQRASYSGPVSVPGPGPVMVQAAPPAARPVSHVTTPAPAPAPAQAQAHTSFHHLPPPTQLPSHLTHAPAPAPASPHAFPSYYHQPPPPVPSQAPAAPSYAQSPYAQSPSLAYHTQYPASYSYAQLQPSHPSQMTPSANMGGYDYSARHHASATPMGAAPTSSADMNGLIPMETVPVDTPANSRGRFSEVAKVRGAKNGYSREFDPLDYSALPEKTPRIYDHCIKALESGVPTEVEFALHHLVIISDERGDKFRFCDFPNLAESLIEAAWEMSFLVHGVSFEVEYEPLSEDDERLNVLDGCYETPCLVEKIRTLNERDAKERGSSGLELEPVGLSRYERIVKEAVLTFRNMCTLEENAGWVSEIAVFKDLLVYVLNIPEKARSRYVEVVNNVLETAELVCPFWTFKSDDPAIPGLLDLIKQGHDSGNGGTGDRTQLLLALRIFVLWGMEREDQKKELVIMKEGMTDAILRALSDYTLLEQDRELLSTTLDFLYQYTAQPGNVAHLVTSLAPMLPITLVPRLTNLLLFEADPILDERVDQEELLAPPPNDIPDVPPSLHAELVRLPEPERCSTWLKTCFTEDEGCEVTQLALWHAYQRTFQHVNQQYHQYHQQQSATPTTTPGTPMSGPMRGMTPQQQQQHLSHPSSSSVQSPLYPPPPPPPAPTLGAAEFINTVSSAFTTAEAQVIRGEIAKFIIRGIRPLEQPVNITRAGHPYPRCKWLLSVAPEGTTTTAATVGTGMETRSATRYETRCTRAFDDVKGLKEHLFAEHLNLWRQNGAIDERLPGWHFGGDPQERRPQNVCLWDTCRAFPPPHSQFPSHISYPHDSMQQQQQQQQQPPTTATLVNHISSHMPLDRDLNAPAPPIPPRPVLQHRVERVFEYFPTPADKEPLGIAYKALLVLRNIMRNLPSTPPSSENSWSYKLFFSQRTKLLETADYNPVLGREVFELVNEIQSS